MSDAMQNILVLLGILLIGAVGWYMYQENQRMSLDAGEVGGLQAEIQDYVQTQTQLRSITIQTSILSDPAFLILGTVTGPVPEQETGRDNPFAI